MLKLDTKNNRRDARLSKAIRKAAGCQGKPYPIVDVDGFDVPRIEGPNSLFIWNNLGYDYNNSSLHKRVVVGRGWICENGLV